MLTYIHIGQHQCQGVCQQQTDDGTDQGKQERKTKRLEILYSSDGEQIFKCQMSLGVGNKPP